MSHSRPRWVLFVLAAALAVPLGPVPAWAQARSAEPPAAAAQAPAPDAGAKPDAAPPTDNGSAAAPGPAPAAQPAPAEAIPAPETEDKAAAADPFGEEVTLTPRTVVTLTGNASWETAFETLIDSFKKLSAALDRQKIEPAGPFIVIYTATDDAGFTYFTEIPVATEPKDPGDGIAIGKSPEGRMLKFVHRGSYDNMDNTYEAITNHLDERKLEAKDMFIEEYVTNPLTTAEDKLVINVFVPLK